MNITLLFIILKILKYLKYLLSSERYRIAYQRNIILFAANINSYQTMKMGYEELKYILESKNSMLIFLLFNIQEKDWRKQKYQLQ